MRKQTKLTSYIYGACWGTLLAACVNALLPPMYGPYGWSLIRRTLPIIIMCLLLLSLMPALLSRWSKPIKAGPIIRPRSRNLSVIIILYTGEFVLMAGVLTGVIFHPFTRQIGQVLGVLMLLLLAALLLSVRSSVRSRYIDCRQAEKSKRCLVWGASLLAFACIGATFWIPEMWGVSWPKPYLGNLLDPYTGQLSLTFITISVMSVLSDKSVVVYWENIAEAKLIKPLFGSFASYTAYSITATVGAGISVLLEKDLAFIVFFSMNVLVLILLTWTMVDVYYGRETKKLKREWELRREAALCLTAPNPEKDTLQSADSATYMPALHSYQEKMFRLHYHLHQEIEAHNIPFINEVADLYSRNMHCFRLPEGQAVEKLLFSAPHDIWPTILEGLDAMTADMEQFQSYRTNPFLTNKWCLDSAAWYAFSRSAYLQKWLEDDTADGASRHIALAWPVAHRMTALYNDMVTLTCPKDVRGQRHATLIRYPDRILFTYDTTLPSAALTKAQQYVVVKDGLLDALAHLILLLVKTEHPSVKAIFSQCPPVSALTPYLNQLGFTDEETVLWRKIFGN